MTEVTASGHGANPGLKVDGVKVAGTQEALVTDANTAVALTAEATDSPDRVETNTAINANGTKINAILLILKNHGLMASV